MAVAAVGSWMEIRGLAFLEPGDAWGGQRDDLLMCCRCSEGFSFLVKLRMLQARSRCPDSCQAQGCAPQPVLCLLQSGCLCGSALPFA